MLKIRRPLGRLIFNMGIAIPGKTVFLIETAPWTIAANALTPCLTRPSADVTFINHDGQIDPCLPGDLWYFSVDELCKMQVNVDVSSEKKISTFDWCIVCEYPGIREKHNFRWVPPQEAYPVISICLFAAIWLCLHNDQDDVRGNYGSTSGMIIAIRN